VFSDAISIFKKVYIFISVAPNKVVRAALNRLIQVLSVGVMEVAVAALYA